MLATRQISILIISRILDQEIVHQYLHNNIDEEEEEEVKCF